MDTKYVSLLCESMCRMTVQHYVANSTLHKEDSRDMMLVRKWNITAQFSAFYSKSERG
jgi:hypothetical protein